jgi:hypothetical protein
MAKKIERDGKLKNVHCRTGNVEIKLIIIKNEQYPLDDLKNDKITEKCE